MRQIGLGARLFQYDDKEEYSIAYASRALRDAETRYTTTEQELLAVIWALKKWNIFLYGQNILIKTDHKALTFATGCLLVNDRMTRWILTLQNYKITWEHIPGRTNQVPDTLSRFPIGLREGIDPEIYIRLMVDINEGLSWKGWLQKIALAQQQHVTEYKDKEYEIRKGLVRIKYDQVWKIFIPNEITTEFIQQVHKFLTHFGTDKVVKWIQSYFVINNLERKVREIVTSCDVCQKTKIAVKGSRGELYYDIPQGPNEQLSIDLFGELPRARLGLKYILVVMDKFSKFTKLYPLKRITAENVTRIMLHKHFPKYGIPETILTDRGAQFTGEKWKNLGTELGVRIIWTTPYNPPSNPVERVMREIGRIIRVYANEKHTRWERLVPRIEQAINSTHHSGTNFRPYELHLNVDEGLKFPEWISGADHHETKKILIGNLEENIKKARRCLIKQADKRYRTLMKRGIKNENYQIGDKGLLRQHFLSSKDKKFAKKFALIYDGPFEITGNNQPNVFELTDEKGKIKGKYNHRQIKRYKTSTDKVDGRSIETTQSSRNERNGNALLV